MANKAVAGNDAIYLHMEEPDNLMYITGILTFETVLDAARVKQAFEERMLKFGRFRQIPKQAGTMSGYRWTDTEHVDMDDHFTAVQLPAPGDQETLEAAMNKLISTPLPSDKPLWDLHLFNGFGTGCALMVRIHHSIGDGIALVYVLLSVMDTTEKRIAIGKKKRASWVSRLGRPLGLALRTPTALQRMLTAPSEPDTMLNGEIGAAKHVTWSQPVRLDVIKAIGKSAGATINDLLLTMLAGSFRAYLLEAGEQIEREIRVAVPVNVRPMSKAYRLGNQIGSISLVLPIRETDRWERLQKLKERMDGLKTSPELLISYAATRIIGVMPKKRATRIIANSRAKTSALVSNVPGPQAAISLAGEPAATMMFWGPLTGRGALGVSLISYNGDVRIGVFGDKAVIPNPRRIIDGFTDEFAAFQADWKRKRAA